MRAKIMAPLGAVAVLAACTLSSSPVQAQTGCPAPLAVAHRGDSSVAPEETAQAVVAALNGGANVVEMDVRWSRSAIAVLMHDATVNRTTTSTGYVSSYWLWQLRAMDAGAKFSPGYRGAKIITLGEAFRLIQPRAGVRALPELKGSLTDYQLAVVAKAITDNKMAGRVVVQSFSATLLQRFHKIAPTVPLALVTGAEPADPVAALKAAYASYWLPNAGTLTADHLAAAQAAGIKVWPWTADSPAEWDRLATLGVDGILTDQAAQYVGWATGRCGVAP